jgi:DNA replication and repair protein RecF
LLREITLNQFRSFAEKQVTIDADFHQIIGPNGTGKSNLLEAIYLLVTGRSFRTNSQQQLIQYGQAGFCVQARFERHGIQETLRIQFDGEKRRIEHNGVLCKTVSELFGLLPGVLWGPHDEAIVSEGPAYRRRFLDLQIAQADPMYVHHLIRFHRAMKQRNQLLKEQQVLTLGQWEEEMARSGAYIVTTRHKVVLDLAMRAGGQYQQLATRKGCLRLVYNTQLEASAPMEQVQNQLKHAFETHRQKEMEVKRTITGPHKDELVILLDEKPARTFASEGERRLIVASLKQAEWQRLNEQVVDTPLFLVDDFGISLDPDHQQAIIESFSQMGQVIVTCPRPLLQAVGA